MKIKTAKFVKSATSVDLSLIAKQVAMVGRSNVGKSTLINYLTNNKIAKVSSSPGRTRLINYFDINNGEFLLVDLPGYGYSKSDKQTKQAWGKMVEDYLKNSPNLVNILFLVDIRHKPTSDDLTMLNYLNFYNIPFTIVATKADKLSRAQQNNQRAMLASELKVGTQNIYLVSSEKKFGAEQLLQRLEQFIVSGD